MGKQIYNELYKILRQPFLWLSLALILVLCIGYAKTNRDSIIEDSIDTTWKIEAQDELNALKDYLAADKFEYVGEKEDIKSAIEILEIRLKYDVHYGEWRNLVLIDYINSKNEEDADKMNLYLSVLNGDLSWKDYYVAKVDEYKAELNQNGDSLDTEEQLEEAMLRIEYDISPVDDKSNWKNECLLEYLSNKTLIMAEKSIDKLEWDYQKICDYEKQNVEYMYRIKNNIKSNEYISLANYLKSISGYRYIFVLIIIILSIISICQEYSYNTWKNLLTQTKSRKAVILSKMCSLQITAFIICAVTYIFSMVIGIIFYGTEISDAVIQVGESVFNINYVVYIAINYILLLLELMIYILVTIVISIMVENSIAVMGTMLVIVLGIPKVATALYETNKITILKYLPSLNFDFVQFLDKKTLIWGMSPYLAVCMYVICFILGVYCMIKLFKNEEI